MNQESTKVKGSRVRYSGTIDLQSSKEELIEDKGLIQMSGYPTQGSRGFRREKSRLKGGDKEDSSSKIVACV